MFCVYLLSSSDLENTKTCVNNFNSYIGDLPTIQEANATDKAVSGDPAERNLKLWIGVTFKSDRKFESGVCFCEKKNRLGFCQKTFVSK